MMEQRGKINFFRIPVDRNSYSLITIGSREFPVHLSFDNLTNYENCFVNWHMQREIEISLVTDGALNVCLPGSQKIFHAGDCFIIFPDVLHSIKKVEKEACEYRTLLFDPRFLYGYPGSYWEKAYYAPLLERQITLADFEKVSSGPSFPELYPLLGRATEGMSPMEQMNLQHNLQTVWVSLFSESDVRNRINRPSDRSLQQTAGTDERILQILAFLNANYREKFSLDRLSSAVHLSRSECCRCFRKNMNMTLLDYLLEIRVGAAMNLLEQTSLSMTEISNETGFSSSSYFSRAFREKAGMTPMEYKRKSSRR